MGSYVNSWLSPGKSKEMREKACPKGLTVSPLIRAFLLTYSHEASMEHEWTIAWLWWSHLRYRFGLTFLLLKKSPHPISQRLALQWIASLAAVFFFHPLLIHQRGYSWNYSRSSYKWTQSLFIHSFMLPIFFWESTACQLVLCSGYGNEQ